MNNDNFSLTLERNLIRLRDGDEIFEYIHKRALRAWRKELPLSQFVIRTREVGWPVPADFVGWRRGRD